MPPWQLLLPWLRERAGLDREILRLEMLREILRLEMLREILGGWRC